MTIEPFPNRAAARWTWARKSGPAAAAFVDKVLKGAKPADIPVELPAKFNLTINLKTAKRIGITIPPELLFRATKVIK